VKNCNEPIKSEEALKNILSTWLSALVQPAINRINELRAYSRREVSGYKNVLWLWNRLDTNRWAEVQKPMKRKKAPPKLEVDHAVPVAIWENKVGMSYPFNSSRDSATGIENVFMLSDINFTRSQLLSWINNIGNCSLLLRSHNRSKNDEQFGDFLRDVYDNNQIDKFSDSLKLSDVLLNPNNKKLDEIVKDVNKRTEIIRNDLKDFFNGIKSRMDI
jgi:hypothetical protein